MTAFEDLAALVHEQHRLASRVETWRDCELILCHWARRLTQVTPMSLEGEQQRKPAQPSDPDADA